MGKPFQRKALFSFLPAAAILIIGAILLNSCGQGNPAGSQAGTTAATSPGAQAQNSPAATIPLSLTSPPVKVTLVNTGGTATASSAAVTITWDSYPGAASYNLYWSNTPDFASATKIAGVASPYTFQLPDTKDYYFFLTGVIDGTEQRISGNFMSLFQDGERINLNIPFDAIYNWAKSKSSPVSIRALSTTNNSFPVGPFTATVSLTKASNHVIWLTIYRTEPLPDGNTAIFDAIGVYYQYTDNFKQHISVAARSTIRLQPWQVITSSVPITDFGQFNGNTSLITYTSPVNTLPGRYEIHGSGMWGDNTGYHLIPSTVAADVNGQVISSSTDYNIYGPMIQFELTPTKKLQKIDILPSNAIAYLHPPASNPSSGTAQFTATGNYSDNTTKDITSSATWSSSDPTIANINAGLATPRKPGTCQISATQDGVKSSDLRQF